MSVELFITAEDHAYLKGAIQKRSYSEIGFLGIVETSESAGLVKHLRILKQAASSGSVDFDDEAFADYLEWLYTPADNGGAGFEGTDYGLYSAHSHGNMSTFFSGTDEEAIKKYGMTAPWVYSSVFNSKGESDHRLDVFKEVNHYCPLITSEQITFTKAKLWVLPHPSAQPILDEINKTKKEFDDQIGEITKVRDDTIKALEDNLKDATQLPLDGIRDKVDDDFKELVRSGISTGPTKGKSTGSTHNTGGSSGGKGSGKRSQKQQSRSSSARSSHNGTSPGKGEGEEGGNVDRETVLRYIYQVYDCHMQTVYGATLETIMNNDDLILLEPAEDWVLRLLKEEEIILLAKRDSGNFMDIEDAISQLTGSEGEEKPAEGEPLTDEEAEEQAYQILLKNSLTSRELALELGFAGLPKSIVNSKRITTTQKKRNQFPILKAVEEKKEKPKEKKSDKKKEPAGKK